MRGSLVISALAGLAAAAPRPQDIDFEEISSEPTPTVVGPAASALNDPVQYDAQAAAASASAAVIAELTLASKSRKEREIIELQTIHKRTPGDCARQPDGYGPKPAEDTVDAFLSYDAFAVSPAMYINGISR